MIIHVDWLNFSYSLLRGFEIWMHPEPHSSTENYYKIWTCKENSSPKSLGYIEEILV